MKSLNKKQGFSMIAVAIVLVTIISLIAMFFWGQGTIGDGFAEKKKEEMAVYQKIEKKNDICYQNLVKCITEKDALCFCSSLSLPPNLQQLAQDIERMKENIEKAGGIENIEPTYTEGGLFEGMKGIPLEYRFDTVAEGMYRGWDWGAHYREGWYLIKGGKTSGGFLIPGMGDDTKSEWVVLYYDINKDDCQKLNEQVFNIDLNKKLATFVSGKDWSSPWLSHWWPVATTNSTTVYESGTPFEITNYRVGYDQFNKLFIANGIEESQPLKKDGSPMYKDGLRKPYGCVTNKSDSGGRNYQTIPAFYYVLKAE